MVCYITTQISDRKLTFQNIDAEQRVKDILLKVELGNYKQNKKKCKSLCQELKSD